MAEEKLKARYSTTTICSSWTVIDPKYVLPPAPPDPGRLQDHLSQLSTRHYATYRRSKSESKTLRRRYALEMFEDQRPHLGSHT